MPVYITGYLLTWFILPNVFSAHQELTDSPFPGGASLLVEFWAEFIHIPYVPGSFILLLSLFEKFYKKENKNNVRKSILYFIVLITIIFICITTLFIASSYGVSLKNIKQV